MLRDPVDREMKSLVGRRGRRRSLRRPPCAAIGAVILAACSGLAADAAQRSRKLPVVPPEYRSMAPPEAGESYVDPAFLTTVTRLTDSSSFGPEALAPEYSESSSFNLDDTFVILFATNGGSFEIFDANGRHVRRLVALRPRWSRTNPSYLYFDEYGRNSVWRHDVVAGSTDKIKTFSEYREIDFGKGQGDISDNDRIAVIAEDRYVFVYDLLNDTKHGVLDTETLPNGANAASITPDGDGFIVTWNGERGPGRGRGIELFDIDGNFVAQLLNTAAHGSVGRDVDGTQVYFATNVATLPQQPARGCSNGIIKVSLEKDVERTCLVGIVEDGGHWATETHMSGLAGDGWVYVSTFRKEATPEDWMIYDNEIFRVRADGSVLERLVHHRSAVLDYWSEPHANISISGKKLVYGSDFYPAGQLETYVIDLTDDTDR